MPRRGLGDSRGLRGLALGLENVRLNVGLGLVRADKGAMIGALSALSVRPH